MHDLPIYHNVLPELADHPLFQPGATVGMMSAGVPLVHPPVAGEEHALRKMLKQSGLHHVETSGHYYSPEKSFIIYGPTREDMYKFGKALGQETVIFSTGGKHEMMHTNGPHDGHYQPSHDFYGFHPKHAPPDYWTHLPGRGYLRLCFKDQKLPSPLKPQQDPQQPQGASPAAAPQQPSDGLMKALENIAAALKKPKSAWAGAYPKHEAHASYHHRGNAFGIVVDDSYGHHHLQKDTQEPQHPHTVAHGPEPKTDFSGGQATKTNDQAGIAGTSKAYGKFAAPYGTVDKSKPSTLKFYPLEGMHDAATAQVAHHGYTHYYAGGKHGKPDLINRNYANKHIMVYDPEAGSGGDFGDTSYTDAWRKTHELAHALTYDQLNQKYGEGRRIGALGKHRTLREAKRAVEWEWMAAHKQRELASQIGVHISDEDFHKELGTVMHDAVHRAVTGKFTDPQEEGFQPHSHKVPLSTAMSMLNESAAQLGLQHEHDLLKKSTNDFVSPVSSNLIGDKGPNATMSQVTNKDIKLGLAKALRDALVKHEKHLIEMEGVESRGKAKLAKSGDMCATQMDKCGDIKKYEDLEEAPANGCPACSSPEVMPLGAMGNRDHSICKGCGISFSSPRQENAEAAALGKEEIPDVGTIEEKPAKGAVLPGDKKSKVIDAEGSGGKITKSLRKDMRPVVGMVPGSKSPGKLPGMTPSLPPGASPGPNKPETLETLHSLNSLAQGVGATKNPALAPTVLATPKAVTNPGRTTAFVKKPAADDVPAAGPPGGGSDAITGSEKRAAGIGFLSNLISKFKGAGNANWAETGSGSSGAGVGAMTGRRAAARMMLAEKPADKKPLDKAALAPNDPNRHTNLPSMSGAKSIASNPTAIPQLPGLPKPKMAKAGTGVPAAPKPPGMPAPAGAAKPPGTKAAGPTKPKAPPGSAPALKEEMAATTPDMDKGLSTTNHNRILLGS